MRILIVGGYGTFGGRLAELLKDEPRNELLIAGRSESKAAVFCAALGGSAPRRPLAFDREGDVVAALTAAAPELVVDATGPFQAYGADRYRLVEAAIACGIDYMDLADGSDFVNGIGAFDALAKARGVAVLAGVSSFPVLMVAVVRHLSQDLAEVDSVTGGIAPSPYAGVGLNVIKAIAGYAGKPVRLRRGGRTVTAYALTETLRATIAPPGRLPLHNTRFSLVDVPDLQALPQLWPRLDAVWMGAGPVPEILHRALSALAWTVRLGLVPSLGPLAPLFHRAINLLRWGEHRGGMLVRIQGRRASGEAVTRSWHLLAEGNDGPLIPSMAIAALVHRRLDGHRPVPGARPAVAELELADYQALFARRTIHAGTREDSVASRARPLYQRVLGPAFAHLPAPLRRLHDIEGVAEFAGEAIVERGRNPLARLVTGLFGFPRAGEGVPVRVRLHARDGGEVWTRDFAGKRFSSVQSEGKGRWAALLCERFGPFNFGLALVIDGDRLSLVPRRWSVLGLPLPLALAPRGNTYEHGEDGRFHFHVEIGLPLVGLLVRYQGHLLPVAGTPATLS